MLVVEKRELRFFQADDNKLKKYAAHPVVANPLKCLRK